MKIIQISDLHIDNGLVESDYQNMVNKMIECINTDMADEKCVYILCCGDVVNQGNPSQYFGKATEIFNHIRNNIKCKKLELLFVPGNHDLCNDSFEKFQCFVERYNSKINFISKSIILYEGSEINYILVNSCYHRDYRYGNIDIELLEKNVKKSLKPTFVVMHHTLLSRYIDDRSAISNAYKFLDILDNSNVIGVLHGHTHGYSNILVGENCRIIGVGSLFAYIPNCNNQFNIIDVELGKVERVINYRYNFDLDGFNRNTIFENLKRNSFTSSKISTIYNKVNDSVNHFGSINGLYINVNTNLEEYRFDMEKNFGADIETAKLWLKEEVPSTLYYNHGQYMVDPRSKGIDYIIDELVRNSTSNRAIIPLIRFSDVLDKQYSHLPGLNSIQFGFSNDEKTELYCSTYLRSLEVNHFLKINLSEIYLLIMQICKEIRSIKRLVINMYAFKAQYKERFSCFRKAKIDTLNIGMISKYVYQKNIFEIVDLLKDKFEMEETVINTVGITHFYDILKESGLYDEEIIIGLNEIIIEMENLKQEYMKSSNYAEIKPIEDRIHKKQNKYIDLFSNVTI